MIFEHEFIDLANTAIISNISTRGQPITSTFCKKDPPTGLGIIGI